MAFRQTLPNLIKIVGNVKITDLPHGWQTPVNTVLAEKEKENPKIAEAKIKGSQPHKSHTDPHDKEDVISVQLLDARGARVESIHIHEDGTIAPKPK